MIIEPKTEEQLGDAITSFEQSMLRGVRGLAADVTASLSDVLTAAVGDQVPRETPEYFVNAWQDVVNGDLLPRVANAYGGGAEDVYLQVVGAYTGPPENVASVASTAAEAYLSTASNRMVAVSDTLWRQARAQMVEGLRNGESIDQIAARLMKVSDWALSRCQTVARTEVVAANNAGAIAEMRAVGASATKRWVATYDSKTRTSHYIANGQTVDLEAKFRIGSSNLDFPGDPTAPPEEAINCRCTLTFSVNVRRLNAEINVAELPDVSDQFDPDNFIDLDELLASSRNVYSDYFTLTEKRMNVDTGTLRARMNELAALVAAPSTDPDAWGLAKNFSESKVKRDNKGRFAKKAGGPDIDVDVPSVSTAPPGVAAGAKKMTNAVVYGKHDDGTTIYTADGMSRMRYNKTKNKWEFQEQDGDGNWTTTETLGKAAAYKYAQQVSSEWGSPVSQEESDLASKAPTAPAPPPAATALTTPAPPAPRVAKKIAAPIPPTPPPAPTPPPTTAVPTASQLPMSTPPGTPVNTPYGTGVTLNAPSFGPFGESVTVAMDDPSTSPTGTLNFKLTEVSLSGDSMPIPPTPPAPATPMGAKKAAKAIITPPVPPTPAPLPGTRVGENPSVHTPLGTFVETTSGGDAIVVGEPYEASWGTMVPIDNGGPAGIMNVNADFLTITGLPSVPATPTPAPAKKLAAPAAPPPPPPVPTSPTPALGLNPGDPVTVDTPYGSSVQFPNGSEGFIDGDVFDSPDGPMVPVFDDETGDTFNAPVSGLTVTWAPNPTGKKTASSSAPPPPLAPPVPPVAAPAPSAPPPPPATFADPNTGTITPTDGKGNPVEIGAYLHDGDNHNLAFVHATYVDANGQGHAITAGYNGELVDVPLTENSSVVIGAPESFTPLPAATAMANAAGTAAALSPSPATATPPTVSAPPPIDPAVAPSTSSFTPSTSVTTPDGASATVHDVYDGPDGPTAVVSGADGVVGHHPVSSLTPGATAPLPAMEYDADGVPILSDSQKLAINAVLGPKSSAKWYSNSQDIFEAAHGITQLYPEMSVADVLAYADANLHGSSTFGGKPFSGKVEKWSKTKKGSAIINDYFAGATIDSPTPGAAPSGGSTGPTSTPAPTPPSPISVAPSPSTGPSSPGPVATPPRIAPHGAVNTSSSWYPSLEGSGYSAANMHAGLTVEDPSFNALNAGQRIALIDTAGSYYFNNINALVDANPTATHTDVVRMNLQGLRNAHPQFANYDEYDLAAVVDSYVAGTTGNVSAAPVSSFIGMTVTNPNEGDLNTTPYSVFGPEPGTTDAVADAMGTSTYNPPAGVVSVSKKITNAISASFLSGTNIDADTDPAILASQAMFVAQKYNLPPETVLTIMDSKHANAFPGDKPFIYSNAVRDYLAAGNTWPAPTANVNTATSGGYDATSISPLLSHVPATVRPRKPPKYQPTGTPPFDEIALANPAPPVAEPNPTHSAVTERRWFPVNPEFPQTTEQRALAWRAQSQPMTTAQQDGIIRYTGNSFTAINAAMRGVASANNLSDANRDAINDATAGMRPSSYGQTLYRGADHVSFPIEYDGDDADFIAQLRALSAENVTVTDRSFMSSSVGSTAAFDHKPIIMQIEAPPGTMMQYVNDISIHQGEREMMLAPGTQYQIGEVMEKDGKIVVRVRVTGNDRLGPLS